MPPGERSPLCDVIVIGAGLSGLTAAGLLAKSGLSVLVLERNYMPGGACGAFRRRGITFDMGAAMLFGFGERGFNPHRFVMNELEEPVEVVRHKALYRLNYGDQPIVFWPDREMFYRELDRAFPGHEKEIRDFYGYIVDLYENVIAADPVFVAPSEMRRADLAAQFRRHPVKQARTVALLFTSAGRLIRRFIRSAEVIKFFNKLTSTYCYTTMEETPAILASTMFVDNHTGGSYYPVGSPAALAGRMEKAVEKRGGTIRYETEVTEILFEDRRAAGVRTRDGAEFRAGSVIYAGAIKNLYGKLLPRERTTAAERAKVAGLVMTWPSVVLYGVVRADVIPEGTLPVEMFVDNRDALDEREVTVYISSLEDPSLCPPGKHVFTMIGPSFASWPTAGGPGDRTPAYGEQKKAEAKRLLGLLDRRFPGFERAIEFIEIGSPTTIERYLLKNGGSVAGPKNAMGQELMRRAHAATRWPGLFLAGESTVMGTGTPAVTVSGVSAADMVLRERGMKEYRYYPGQKNLVTVVDGPVARRPEPTAAPATASLCQWCEEHFCRNACPASIDIRGILRRMEVGNPDGARRLLPTPLPCAGCAARPCEKACYRATFAGSPVPVVSNLEWLASGESRQPY
jgi:prolycopene isomerase